VAGALAGAAAGALAGTAISREWVRGEDINAAIEFDQPSSEEGAGAQVQEAAAAAAHTAHGDHPHVVSLGRSKAPGPSKAFLASRHQAASHNTSDQQQHHAITGEIEPSQDAGSTQQRAP
jgi:hypothetical protein